MVIVFAGERFYRLPLNERPYPEHPVREERELVELQLGMQFLYELLRVHARPSSSWWQDPERGILSLFRRNAG